MAEKPVVSLMDKNTDSPLAEEIVADINLDLPEDMLTEPDIEGIEITPSEDGGVVIDLDPTATNEGGSGDFYANLAEEMSDQELGSISSELVSEYQSNKSSRKDWEDSYSKGLELLGFTYEERTQPFRGATGVTHPLLAEAATQFQAQAFNELLPAGGPVRTTILGDLTR